MLTAIVGINWGDEGKGRMVDLLSDHYNVVVRYQGGNNAGHTVVNEKGKFILNLLPSGILRDETVNVKTSVIHLLNSYNLFILCCQTITSVPFFYRNHDLIVDSHSRCQIGDIDRNRIYRHLNHRLFSFMVCKSHCCMSVLQTCQSRERTELICINHADNRFILHLIRQFIIAGKVSHANNQLLFTGNFQDHLRFIHFQFKYTYIHRNIGNYSFSIHYFDGSGPIL